MSALAFAELFEFDDPEPKPRQLGRNMCLDDGLGIKETRDIFEVVGAYIDSIRIGRGSAALFPRSWLIEKAALCADYGIDMQTGGPLYETAVACGNVSVFLTEAAELGFTSVEFSENIINLPIVTTIEHLKLAQDRGLEVFFEFGRKYPDVSPLDPEEEGQTLLELLDAGINSITVERGEVDLIIQDAPEVLTRLADLVGLENLIFEAGPRTPHYPELFFQLFDPQKVNLGNISLSPACALDGICIVANARHGLDRSVGYQFIRDIWKGATNYGDHS